jgi:hypothetical protein
MGKQNKYDAQHLRNLGLTKKQIANIYDVAVKEAAAIGASIHDFNSEKPFSFADYPRTKSRINRMINELQKKTEPAIVSGVRSEWTLANNKNNALCDLVFGDNKGKLTREQERKYYSNNDKALDAFLERKTSGLNLSDRVWKYTDQFKNEIEMGIDLGLRDGLPAAEMARDLKQYLQYPDKLFRRVRDEHGQLHLSKAAKDFHPGAGVCRSSYKNAIRLARTENNMAYRTADHERWQQLDFVVGIEIRLSNNHTLNGRPFTDICDDLKGKYPKDFKFTGFHTACCCYAVSILKTPEELAQENEAILAGKEPDKSSANEINDVPENFKQWVEKNKSRIEQAERRGTLPYFIRDNFNNGKVTIGLKFDTSAIKTQIRAGTILNKTTIEASYPEITNKVINVENEIRKNTEFETAVAFDKDGNVVIDKRGQSRSVSFTDDEILKMKDAIMTHNHPLGWKYEENTLGRIGNSFSLNDIDMAIKADMSEIRAVTPTYTFVMKRPANGWPKLNQAIRKMNEIEQKIKHDFNNLIRNSSERSTAVNRAMALHYHKLWKDFSKQYGIEYTKKKTR